MNVDLQNIFSKLNVIGKTEHCATVVALLLTSIPVAVGHGFMFYDANANMFKDTYKIEITEHQMNWPFWFSCFFAGLGAMLHGLHGSMELAEGAHHDPSIPLFYNSHSGKKDGLQQRMAKLIIQDIGINLLLSLAVFAEFGLFYTEFDHQLENSKHLSKVSQAFLGLMGVSFSCISASMYLGHEGQSFLKMDKLVEKISKDYHNLSIKELFQKQLYLLSCLSHAIVHGVTRYQVLQILKFPFAISLLSASVSGLSRLNMLGIDEEEDEEKDNDNEEEHLPPGPIQYDACERGKDVMYETFFIMIIALLYLYEHQAPSDQPGKKEISPWLVAGACSLSELLGELAMYLASCCLKRTHIPNPAGFLINTVTTPLLSGYIVQELKISVFDDRLMNLAAQILMLSLVLRYGKKSYGLILSVLLCRMAL